MEKNGKKWLFVEFFLYFYILIYIYNFDMITFIGDIACKLDGKGRFLFPAVFKKQINSSVIDKFVVKKDIFENCLIIYPFIEWQKQVDLIRKKINPYNKEHSKFLRGFYKNTAEITLDSNNRLLIPKRLLQITGIKKEMLLVGIDSKIEIWAKEIYEKIEHNDEDFAQLAEKILGTQDEVKF